MYTAALHKYWVGVRRTASSHWWSFLLATETFFSPPQTQFIDRVVDIQLFLEIRTHSANCAETVDSQIQFLDRVLFAVAQQREAFTVQTVQKTQTFHGPGAVLGGC